MSESFTAEPMRVLMQISAKVQPIAFKELKKLHAQLEAVMAMDERDLKTMTTAEEVKHIQDYGSGAICIGDFVIKRRNRQ